MNQTLAALAKASAIRAAHDDICHDESFCRCEMFAAEWEAYARAINGRPIYGTAGR